MAQLSRRFWGGTSLKTAAKEASVAMACRRGLVWCDVNFLVPSSPKLKADFCGNRENRIAKTLIFLQKLKTSRWSVLFLIYGEENR